MIYYLAGPYWHYLKSIRDDRVKQLTDFAVRLMEQGATVFSPITYGVTLKQAGLNEGPDTHAFWLNNDLKYLSRCDMLLVYCITGWDISKGVNEEIEYAEKHGIPIKYITPERFYSYG